MHYGHGFLIDGDMSDDVADIEHYAPIVRVGGGYHMRGSSTTERESPLSTCRRATR